MFLLREAPELMGSLAVGEWHVWLIHQHLTTIAAHIEETHAPHSAEQGASQIVRGERR